MRSEWRTIRSRLKVTCLGLACAPWLVAGAASEEDVEAIYGSENLLSLATGYRLPIHRAPATATVLTRDQLDSLGARTLKDALNFVPGFHVATADGRSTFSTVRGITSRVLILVDNIPIPRTMIDPWVGFDNVLLYNVERIEVVRGPGSAVYGADAVAGVINIQTRTGMHADTQEIGISAGWSDTYDAWALFSGELDTLRLSAYAAFSTSEGSTRTVEVDAQSLIDQRLGTSASRAPAPMAQRRESVDVRLDAKLGDFTARLTYYNQDPLQNGAGVAYALDADGEWNSLYKSAQLTYSRYVSSDWLIDAYIDYSDVTQDAYANIFPPGAFGNAFPQGVISSFLIDNERLRAETAFLFSGFKKHTLRFGVGAIDNDFETERDVRNFIVRNSRFLPTGSLAPFGGVGDPPLVGDASADTLFAHVQDEWTVASDWWLTTGVRWDRYSDFGTTVNPRVGLVWNARHNLSAKALVGRAFRPPSVLELQSSGVFSARGNPNLEPTTLDMAELGLNLHTARVKGDLSLYRYRQEDLIQVVPAPTSPNGTEYVNRGENNGWGLEASVTLKAAGSFDTTVSYAFQDRIGDDADDNANIRFAPHHIANWQLDYRFAPFWRASLMARAVIDRERPTSDPRPNPDDYLVVNALLSRANISDLVDASLTVNNIFDEDVRDASPSPATLPFDIPLPGRTWFVHLTWRR